MPAFYAGKRVGKPLLNGHTYNALFNGKLVWPLDRDTVVSVNITDDKGKPLPKSLAVSGTLKLGAKATYADGHVGDLLTTNDVTFASRDTSTATVSGNTLTWRHGGTILVTATVNGFTSAEATPTAKDGDLRIQLESGTTAHEWMRPDNTSLRGGYELANLYPRVTGLPKTVGAAPGIKVTETTPGTYRFKGSTTTGAGSWDNLTNVVHVDAGTYTMDATDWPLGDNSWLMGIQAHISHDDGSEGANAFGPRNYGPKTLKAGTLQCNIFVNTTGEVDKTFTPRLYKID